MSAIPIISAPPPNVRLAEPRDEDEIIAMCRRLHAENAIFAMSDDRVRATVRKGLNRDQSILGVIGPPGNIQASIYLTVAQFWYTNSQHLEEIWNYVLPEFRNSRNAKDLISYAKWCSDTIGLPLMIGILSTIRLEAKQRLYERQLGSPAGVLYLHNRKAAGG